MLHSGMSSRALARGFRLAFHASPARACASRGAGKSLKFPSTGLRPWLWLFRRYAAMKPNGQTPVDVMDVIDRPHSPPYPLRAAAAIAFFDSSFLALLAGMTVVSFR